MHLRRRDVGEGRGSGLPDNARLDHRRLRDRHRHAGALRPHDGSFYLGRHLVEHLEKSPKPIADRDEHLAGVTHEAPHQPFEPFEHPADQASDRFDRLDGTGGHPTYEQRRFFDDVADQVGADRQQDLEEDLAGDAAEELADIVPRLLQEPEHVFRGLAPAVPDIGQDERAGRLENPVELRHGARRIPGKRLAQPLQKPAALRYQLCNARCVALRVLREVHQKLLNLQWEFEERDQRLAEIPERLPQSLDNSDREALRDIICVSDAEVVEPVRDRVYLPARRVLETVPFLSELKEAGLAL
jgi:hypothetical protein